MKKLFEKLTRFIFSDIDSDKQVYSLHLDKEQIISLNNTLKSIDADSKYNDKNIKEIRGVLCTIIKSFKNTI